ncbi:hypothetical protein [Bacillus sp. T33-2]|uniref:hypothetical protein n=1 Tax=Bacillus sp. T33-2 TaxID=2054168 RepID=UPI0015E12997|nr:hypothetical protein [Bacillus sp. T33-2]
MHNQNKFYYNSVNPMYAQQHKKLDNYDAKQQMVQPGGEKARQQAGYQEGYQAGYQTGYQAGQQAWQQQGQQPWQQPGQQTGHPHAGHRFGPR